MKHFYTIWHYYNNLNSKFVDNLNTSIENRNAQLILRQLRHRLRMVNCRGNRQHPWHWCGQTELRTCKVIIEYIKHILALILIWWVEPLKRRLLIGNSYMTWFFFSFLVNRHERCWDIQYKTLPRDYCRIGVWSVFFHQIIPLVWS